MDEIMFSDLSKEVLSAFVAAESIGGFLDSVSRILDEPVLIIDGAYKVLSSSPVRGFSDYQWEKAISDGYYSDEMVAEIVKNFRKNDRLIFTQEPFDRSHSLSEYGRTICKLLHDGAILGSLVVLRVNPFTQEKRELLPLICRLSLRFPLAVKEQLGAGDERFFAEVFLDLILGEIKTREMLSSRLVPAGLDLPESFRLLTVYINNYSKTTVGNLKLNFERIFPGAWTIYHNNHLHILLFGAVDAPDISHRLEEITSILEKYSLVMCCGERFGDALMLRSNCFFNIAALDLAERMGGGKTLISYNDYRFMDIVLNASQRMNTPLENLVSHKILEIRSWDRQYGTNYFETLYVFLTSEKNYAVSAQKLWTHRNTVVYRMGKIKELFGVRLDTFEDYFSILCGCVVMHGKDLLDGEKPREPHPPEKHPEPEAE